MRWRCGCGVWRRSATLPSRCSIGRSSAATFSGAAARADPRDQAAGMVGDALRPAFAPMRGGASARRGPRALAQAHGLVACRSARSARTADRASSRTGAALDEYLIEYLVEPRMRATVLASSFAAMLELVREGQHRSASAGRSRRFIAQAAEPAQTEVPSEDMAARRIGSRIGEWVRGRRGPMSRRSTEMRDDRRGQRPTSSGRSAPRNCACSKRCCLPPRRRSTRRPWRASARRRRRARAADAAAEANMPRAASTSSTSATNGRYAPPTISPGCSRMRRSSRASCRAPRSRRSPSSPITSRSRAPRSRTSAASPRQGHARRAAGNRLGPAARPAQVAGTPAHLWHHEASCRISGWRR